MPRTVRSLKRVSFPLCSLASRPYFASEGKYSLVNSLFHSDSTHWNVGEQYRLCCATQYMGIMVTKKAEWSRQCAQESRLWRHKPRSWEGCQFFFVDNRDELASFVNRQWKVWMPVWLFPGLSIADRGFSFQDFPLEPPRKTSFAMKCLRMVLSYATVVPLFTWQPYFNFYHHREQKWNRSFTRVFFSSVVINETTVCTVSSGSWFIDTSLALPWHWGPHKIRTRVPEIDDCTDPVHAGHRSQALWVWPGVNLPLYRHVETTYFESRL